MPTSQVTRSARASWWVCLSDAFKLTPVPGGHQLHATTVAWDGRAVLIAGPSGSGKSTLALELMAYGARLVADDVTLLTAQNGLWARAPDTLPKGIEARGLGLLAADLLPRAQVTVALDLTRRTAARMPQSQEMSLLGQQIPLLHSPESGPFAAKLLQYLKAGPL